MPNPDISILYAEDDDIVRDIIITMLQERYSRHQVVSAQSAEEGLELFARFSPSIVVTDINLNGSSGLGMARDIRRMAPETVIIFITGCSDVELISGFDGNGSIHYICKPIDYHSLFYLLDSYVHIMDSDSHAVA